MLTTFEFPVIETYTQLAWVLAVVAIVIIAGRSAWRAARRRRNTPRRVSPSPAAAAHALKPTSPGGIEFEKLVSVVADAGDQAMSISRTQEAAAVKIDSTEMAVNRLVADLSGIMTMPGAAANAANGKAGTNVRRPAA